jgi:hypothetical protein
VKRSEKWQIKLEAETSLLEKLSVEFSDPALHIFHDSDCWFLESTYLDSDKSSEIYATGEKLVDYLNHTLWLYAYRPNSIKSNGYCLLTSAGERVSKFLAIGKGTAPTRLIVYSNDIPGRNSFDLFSEHEKVRESLAFFNNAEIDWFTLYKIYETARDDEPDIPTTNDGIALIEKWGGIDENKRFFETANWQRHSVFGKIKGKLNKPADNPMTLSEAQRFVRTVLIAWLEHKSTIKSQTQSN